MKNEFEDQHTEIRDILKSKSREDARVAFAKLVPKSRELAKKHKDLIAYI